MNPIPITRQAGRILIDAQELEYLWTRSPRRSRMALRVTSSGAVEVRTPIGSTLRRVEIFLREHGAWLLARRSLLLEASRRRPPLAEGFLLPHLDATLTLRIMGPQATRVRRSGDELLLPPPLTPGDLERTLERWYRREARTHLVARLRARAREMGIELDTITIRGQKSRWGSCSSRGGINLNWQLMLLPSRVVEYVLVHELCHRQHMNHSPAFWSLVGSHLPDYPLLKKQLEIIQTPWRPDGG
ncbi:MAG: M48 family metallopeptidase [Magnetococcales bacterium]|nr:M48 family metallopeptidase [Magnetococcales bacterium]